MLSEVNFFLNTISTNECFTVQWLYSNFHNIHKSKIPRSLHLPWANRHSQINLSVSSKRCLLWAKVHKALLVTSSYQRFALFPSQHLFCLFYFFSWSFSASRSAERIPSFFSSSTRSPFWCIWRSISQPPTNSPLRYTCGMVGQLE